MDGRGNVISELCGEGFRDIRGLISCKGCGLKFRSGAEFGKHATHVEERKKNRLELAELIAIRGREEGGKSSVLCDANVMRDYVGSGAAKQSKSKRPSMKKDTATRVMMPGSAPVGMPFFLHYIFAWALGVFACRRNKVPGPEGNSLIDVAEQPP